MVKKRFTMEQFFAKLPMTEIEPGMNRSPL
jgi:hypothetical protein